MSEILDRPTSVLPSRFGYLMGLYTENYARLARLFAPHRLEAGHYASDPGDGLQVHMHVLERHRYTLELDLSYGFVDERTGLPTPSAQLRMYTDAKQAEAWHCEPGRHLWQVLGPFPEARTVMQHRLRMNSFLNRWLEYLADQGHSIGTLQRIDETPKVRYA
ncbi:MULTISPECIES: DUF1249 domain-containing protein [Oleiagrimonas]|jgi:uncharacterized protein|uniref:DUF1249 domain-containing protein n=1 Tax=Oleiagrimonas citrea TaxID=1665687 RepID=A0A846ZNY0_9GAMM|nr:MULTISPECIES: DUF1249 domain-containing protein [Oleiagrimonas]NKZ39151.1 DUF1249 domain-containing protein [Oleiagrimonas citrea]RAP57752.1 hypothetical protein BTJ49_07635 [Oleiagrimonas sp. MCCC 1A03011]